MKTFGLDKNFDQFNFEELKVEDLEIISGGCGGVSNDAAYGGALGAAGLFLGLGLTVTAPVWGTALLLGASIAASGAAIAYAM